MENYELIDDPERKCYEFDIDGLFPLINYIKVPNGDIYLTHTEVPETLSGRGIGKALVLAVLEDIEKQGLRLIPVCGFVAGYVRKNPQWKRLLKEGVHVG